MDRLSLLRKFVEKASFQVEACELSEVMSFEKKLNIRLPKVYIDFLLLMGHNASDLFGGSDVEFNKLEIIQDEARDLYFTSMKENFPKKNFVILFHQGYSFYYINLNGREDPKVYYFIDGDEGIETGIVYKTLTEYYLHTMKLSSYWSKYVSENPTGTDMP